MNDSFHWLSLVNHCVFQRSKVKCQIKHVYASGSNSKLVVKLKLKHLMETVNGL